MSSDKVKRPLVALAVTAGLLTVAAPASAGTFVGNPGIVAADFGYKEAKGSA